MEFELWLKGPFWVQISSNYNSYVCLVPFLSFVLFVIPFPPFVITYLTLNPICPPSYPNLKVLYTSYHITLQRDSFKEMLGSYYYMQIIPSEYNPPIYLVDLSHTFLAYLPKPYSLILSIRRFENDRSYWSLVLCPFL